MRHVVAAGFIALVTVGVDEASAAEPEFDPATSTTDQAIAGSAPVSEDPGPAPAAQPLPPSQSGPVASDPADPDPETLQLPVIPVEEPTGPDAGATSALEPVQEQEPQLEPLPESSADLVPEALLWSGAPGDAEGTLWAAAIDALESELDQLASEDEAADADAASSDEVVTPDTTVPPVDGAADAATGGDQPAPSADDTDAAAGGVELSQPTDVQDPSVTDVTADSGAGATTPGADQGTGTGPSAGADVSAGADQDAGSVASVGAGSPVVPDAGSGAVAGDATGVGADTVSAGADLDPGVETVAGADVSEVSDAGQPEGADQEPGAAVSVGAGSPVVPGADAGSGAVTGDVAGTGADAAPGAADEGTGADVEAEVSVVPGTGDAEQGPGAAPSATVDGSVDGELTDAAATDATDPLPTIGAVTTVETQADPSAGTAEQDEQGTGSDADDEIAVVGIDAESAESESTESGSAERESTERESAERESAERESAERESAERESAERESTERESAERESAERESTERESAERESTQRESTQRESTQRESRSSGTGGRPDVVVVSAPSAAQTPAESSPVRKTVRADRPERVDRDDRRATAHAEQVGLLVPEVSVIERSAPAAPSRVLDDVTSALSGDGGGLAETADRGPVPSVSDGPVREAAPESRTTARAPEVRTIMESAPTGTSGVLDAVAARLGDERAGSAPTLPVVEATAGNRLDEIARVLRENPASPAPLTGSPVVPGPANPLGAAEAQALGAVTPDAGRGWIRPASFVDVPGPRSASAGPASLDALRAQVAALPRVNPLDLLAAGESPEAALTQLDALLVQTRAALHDVRKSIRNPLDVASERAAEEQPSPAPRPVPDRPMSQFAAPTRSIED